MDPRLRPVTAALALTLGGCSFAFIHGPPANHRQMRFFDCSTSNVLPFLDTVMAAGAVGETLDAVTGSPTTTTSKTELATFAVEAALLGASAVYGFTKTSDCRDAQAAMLARTPPVGPYMLAPPPIDPWTNRSIQAAPPPPGPSLPAPDPER
jgi:hypothetical protein